MGKFKDISGQKHNRLLILEYIGKNKHHKSIFKCICDCGKYHTAIGAMVKRGDVKSCGCLDRETTVKRNMTHGLSKTSEYQTWKRLKNRCYNKNTKDYVDYGGRGIKVCDRWINSFENFFLDMGKRPTSYHSIDRINNDGNYEPSNCRWATTKEQANNKRKMKNKTSKYLGVWFIKRNKKWTGRIKINEKYICIGYHKNEEEAFLARNQMLEILGFKKEASQ